MQYIELAPWKGRHPSDKSTTRDTPTFHRVLVLHETEMFDETKIWLHLSSNLRCHDPFYEMIEMFNCLKKFLENNGALLRLISFILLASLKHLYLLNLV